MRTPIVVLGDFVLWDASLRAGRRLGGSMKTAMIVFVVFVHDRRRKKLRIGVYQTGCSLWQESPILMLTFLLPAIVVRLISWRFL